MAGQCIYYDKLNNQIGIIDKLSLWVIFDHSKKYNNIALELTNEQKSYEKLLKNKNSPFKKFKTNYYIWQVTEDDFIIITHKKLDDLIKDLKLKDNFKLLEFPTVQGKLFKYIEEIDKRRI